MRFREITEALDNPYPFNLQGPGPSHNFAATAETPNGVLRMDFQDDNYDQFTIDFAVGKSMGKTDAGDEFRVFATVVAMMTKWINTVGIEHVESFDFDANRDEHASDGRAKLYARFAKKLASQLNWKLEQSTTANRSTEFFKLTNPKPVPRDGSHWDDLEDNPDLEENVADGKKKGKSRPGQDKKETAKLFPMNKDGKPKPLNNKAAKNSNPNTLFNLGLAESVLVKLERDKRNDIYVLHMVDNKDKHRVELRGEKGYESGNYNQHDRLHQVLDGLGKAVDLGALFAGETVSVNPHHPDGEQALNVAKAVMTNEAKGPCPVTGEAVCKCGDKKLTEAGSIIRQIVKSMGFDDAVAAVFNRLRKNSKHSNRSDEKIKQMAYRAVQKEKDAIKKERDAEISQQFDIRDAETDIMPDQNGLRWDPNTKMYQPIDENFADGKKKGKSRPGRVKRSGASCNGSVTDLRKRAKKYSGERGKMYQWCLNMKSGRKKK